MSKPEPFAGEAVRKLRLAIELKCSVYIYGATGFGKTSVVERVLDRDSAVWISCDGAEEQVMRSLNECDTAGYIVVDDLHCAESTEIRHQILRMIGQDGCRMVLIGRTNLPTWLSPLVLQSRVLVIHEDDLRVTKSEFMALCAEVGFQPSPERVQELLNNSEGNIMVLRYFLDQLRVGSVDEASLSDRIMRAFMDYLDERVISQWSHEVQELLMQMSLVDSFSMALAEYMTGDDNVAMILSRAEKVGNILFCTNDVWHIRPVLLRTLRERAQKVFGHKRCNQLLYNAGRYYEMNGDAVRALKLFEQCGETDSVRSLLVREARKHPGAGNYWELRRYYQALPDADIEREPVLMSAQSVLCSVLMDEEKSEYWYERLREYAARAKGEDRNEAKREFAYLDIALPHRGTQGMAGILKAIPAAIRNTGDALRPFSLTNNGPSLMNGGKDFCEWTKTDTVLAQTLGPLVEKLLGKSGVGLVQTALGESAFEKGEDPFRVLSYLTRAQNQSEENGIPEMIWVDIAIQARQALYMGDREYACRLIDGMLRRPVCAQMPRLAESVRAFSCWLNLFENETGQVRKWLESAPDETVEFCTLDRYQYMIRIQCYLALGETSPAMTLLQRMTAYADYAHRTYIRMECALLKAIVMRRIGRPWQEDLLEVLREIGEYHFVPVISGKGAAILPLLTEVKTAFLRDNAKLGDWFERVMSETGRVARLYPDYLKGHGVDISAFSETALAVLRMQAAGYKTNEIAEKLHITPRTVKYHASENYKKLDARNLVDAVQIAQTLHIL